MNTIEATVSMLEVMPEEARKKVFKFTQQLLVNREASNPFVPVSSQEILNDLAESRSQTAEGKGLDMSLELNRIGEQHGFI